MEYMAPELNDSDITGALQSGLLGESVRQLSVEQLKNPSSGLILQLCTSILDKLTVETDHLGQSLPNRPILDPELYRPNIMRIINVTKLLNHCVPGLVIEVKDIIYPKWKRIRRLLNIFVNYLRFVEYNISTWDEISCQSDEMHKQREELLDQNSKVESALHDVNMWLKQNKERYDEQRDELARLKTQFAQILEEQKEKDKQKTAAKLELSQCTEEFESVNKEVLKLTEEKERLSLQVVNSPQKVLGEKKLLMERKDESRAQTQKCLNQLQEMERKIEVVDQTLKLAKYDVQLLLESYSLVDNLQRGKDDVVKNNFEIESMTRHKQKLHKEIENLKQQFATGEEQSLRMKLKSEKQGNSLKQQLAKSVKDLEALQTSLKSNKHEIHVALQEVNEEMKRFCLQHETKIKKLQGKEKILREHLKEISQNTIKHINSVDVAKDVSNDSV